MQISITGKIVGGEDTDITKVPYQLSLEENELLFCKSKLRILKLFLLFIKTKIINF